MRLKGIVRDNLGRPVDGARIESQDRQVQFSNADGSFLFPEVIVGDGLVGVTISKPDFHTMFWKEIVNLFVLAESSRFDYTTTPLTMTLPTFNLLLAKLVLPVDGSLALALSPNDPTDYVGIPYYSATCYNCLFVDYVAPPDADLLVVVRGGVSGQPPLQTWANGGAQGGVDDGNGGIALVLPRATAGSFAIGARIYSVTVPIPFTITTTSRR